MEHLNFNYNVAIDTINCINDIDFTYHIINTDYPILHTHDDYFEFTIILDGEIVNIRNGIKENIIKNTLFISSTNDSHLIKKITKSVRILNIICRKNAINKILDELYPVTFKSFLENNYKFILSDDIIHLINKNIDTVNAFSSKDWELTNSLLKSIILTILSYLFLKSIEYKPTDNGKYDKVIEKINALKSNTKFFTLCVNDLCYELGFSRTHLNRIFYELFDMSPYDYLLKSKMEYVASLLLYTDYSIKEISTLIGYNSTSRLTHNFKEIYGSSPFDYRKNK